MASATSSDGTRIAYTEVGEGPAVLIVGGAFSTASAGLPLAEALAQRGFRGVAVDRRGRAGSGDTPPYAPEREADDLAAVIAALGGVTCVLGHSSGAVLALFAASVGVPTGHLFLSEPPFRFGEDEAWNLADRMQAAIDSGDPGAAVTAFQREAVGLPEPVIDQIRASPMFATLVPLAQSAVYDVLLTRAVSTPTTAMTSVEVPVTILRGEPTFPMLVTATQRLAERIPSAELAVVPESHDHSVDPAGTAREIALRLR